MCLPLDVSKLFPDDRYNVSIFLKYDGVVVIIKVIFFARLKDLNCFFLHGLSVNFHSLGVICQNLHILWRLLTQFIKNFPYTCVSENFKFVFLLSYMKGVQNFY